MIITMCSKAYPIAIRAAKERPEFMRRLKEDLGARLATVHILEINKLEYSKDSIIQKLPKGTSHFFLPAEDAISFALINLKIQSDGYMIILNGMDRSKYRLVEAAYSFKSMDLFYSYDHEYRFHDDLTGELLAIAWHKRSAARLPISLVSSSAVFALLSCSSPEYVPDNYPITVVDRDYKGEFDTSIVWVLKGKKFAWFPRDNSLYIIENGTKREATKAERYLFEYYKSRSNDTSFRQGDGSRLSIQIPEFENLADATKFIRNNYHNVKVLIDIKRRSDAHYKIASYYLSNWRLIKAYRSVKTGFLYSVTYYEGLRLRRVNRLTDIEGSRLSEEITNVLAVGVTNGMILPYLKEYLNSHGFMNVVLHAIDDGWWIEDETLPKSDKDIRQEMVNTADRVLIGRLGSDDFRIRYADIFDKTSKELLGKFDIIFLTPNISKMTTSYVDESIKFLKEYGILILRLRNGQDVDIMILQDYCMSNNLNFSLMSNSGLPNTDHEFQDKVIIVRRSIFTDKKQEMKCSKMVSKLLGTRLSIESSV